MTSSRQRLSPRDIIPFSRCNEQYFFLYIPSHHSLSQSRSIPHFIPDPLSCTIIMDKIKKAAHNMSKAGHHDTTVHEQVAPAIKHETVEPTRHEDINAAIDKEIHQDHYHRTVQPVKDTEVLPEQHRHRVAATEHRDFDHRNHEATERALRAEAGKLHDQRVVTDTIQTQSRAPAVQGERFHQ